MALYGGIENLMSKILEKQMTFERAHWRMTLRDYMVLVCAALVQGFSVFILILMEKKVLSSRY